LDLRDKHTHVGTFSKPLAEELTGLSDEVMRKETFDHYSAEKRDRMNTHLHCLALESDSSINLSSYPSYRSSFDDEEPSKQVELGQPPHAPKQSL
jgi:hypothetical protein